MKYLTEVKYQQKIEKIKKINRQKQYQFEIQKERDKYKRKFETSKILAVYLFMLLSMIIVYAMIAMWKFGDLSYLGVLISDIAAQILIYGIYCLKAYQAKKAEENLKFKREQSTLSEPLNSNDICQEPDLATKENIGTFTLSD